MGLKSKLGQVVSSYKELKNNIDKKIREIQKSENYTQEYKNQLIAQEKANFSRHKNEFRSSASNFIEESKKRLQDKKKPIVKDLAFELRLNNTLKTIELAGKSLGKEELKGLIEPFKDDYGTIQSLSHILRAQNIEVYDIIPNDGVEYQINEIENSGNSIISGMFYDNDLAMALALSMIPDDVE